MTDPKLVIMEDDWDAMTPTLQAKTMYRTTMALRSDVIGLTHKVDTVINKPKSPCGELEDRVKKLEKWKVGKMAITGLFSFLGGIGGSHLPK